jgi:hypothetical protein
VEDVRAHTRQELRALLGDKTGEMLFNYARGIGMRYRSSYAPLRLNRGVAPS